MSKRHRWIPSRCKDKRQVSICLLCLLRRRLTKACLVGNCWEYLPCWADGWQHVQRTCGPCPGAKEAEGG